MKPAPIVRTRRSRPVVGLGLVAALACAATSAAEGPQTRPPRRLSIAELEDHIRGGWAGKMIGVAYGAPTEFRSNGRVIDGPLPWIPERVANALHQDDLYVQMTYAEVAERLGPSATSADYGEALKATRYSAWHATAHARTLLDRGLLPPRTGQPALNPHAHDSDFQLCADFIGLRHPGLPASALAQAERVGRVSTAGDGLLGGMFVATMYAEAFFEPDPQRIVGAGLTSLPPESAYARTIRDVVTWSALYPDDWRRVWSLLQERHAAEDTCPDGALVPFNIDARLAGAYVTLALLHGRGDFARTLEIATRCGHDSESNPGTAGGVLGTALGYARLPEEYRSGLPALAQTPFDFSLFSLDTIVRSHLESALEAVAAAGGKVTLTQAFVPRQKVTPIAAEPWPAGPATRRLDPHDGDWSFSKGWIEDFTWGGTGIATRRSAASAPGATAELRFSGAGLALVGRKGSDGGRADVFVDEVKVGELDAYVPERTNDGCLWQVFGLNPQPHTLRVVTREDADARSKGRRVEIAAGVVYGAR